MNAALQRFRPLGRRILLRMDEYKIRKYGRIFLIEKHQAEEASGTVVKLGPRNELPIAIGDRVMTVSVGGTNVEIGGKTFRLCMPVDVLLLNENSATDKPLRRKSSQARPKRACPCPTRPSRTMPQEERK